MRQALLQGLEVGFRVAVDIKFYFKDLDFLATQVLHMHLSNGRKEGKRLKWGLKPRGDRNSHYLVVRATWEPRKQ